MLNNYGPSIEEVHELSESETEREDEISNIDVMLKTWKFLNPPISEDDIIDGWYAGIFSNKKSTKLYIGKHGDSFQGMFMDPVLVLNSTFETKCFL